MSRLFHDLRLEPIPRQVPDPRLRFFPPEPEPEPEPVEEPVPDIELDAFDDMIDVLLEDPDETLLDIEEPPEPTWFDLWSADEAEHAQALVLAAQMQADTLRRRAQAEGEAEGYADGYQEGLAKGQAAGYQEGYARGYEDGRALALAEAAASLHTAASVAAAAQIDRAQLLDAVEPELVELVIAIARKVVQAELTTDPTLVRQCVQTALRAVGDSPTAVLHLHPDDIEVLGDVWEELRQRFGDGGLQLAPDARIQRGGCIVDAETRTVDAQVESRLDEVLRQFLRIADTSPGRPAPQLTATDQPSADADPAMPPGGHS